MNADFLLILIKTTILTHIFVVSVRTGACDVEHLDYHPAVVIMTLGDGHSLSVVSSKIYHIYGHSFISDSCLGFLLGS